VKRGGHTPITLPLFCIEEERGGGKNEAPPIGAANVTQLRRSFPVSSEGREELVFFNTNNVNRFGRERRRREDVPKCVVRPRLVLTLFFRRYRERFDLRSRDRPSRSCRIHQRDEKEGGEGRDGGGRAPIQRRKSKLQSGI